MTKSTSTKLGVEQMSVINLGVLDQDEVNIFFQDAKGKNIIFIFDLFSQKSFIDN